MLSYTIPLSTQQGPLVKLCPTNVSASQDRCEDAMEILNVKMHLKQENNIEKAEKMNDSFKVLRKKIIYITQN